MTENAQSAPFPPQPTDKADLEEGSVLTPRFDDDGLVTAVVSDADDGTVLMLAHMNSRALSLTISTGIAHYYSRSRKSLWKKGETSGNLQQVVEARVDCDQDAVWLKVRVEGHNASCHTGRKGCFYRRIAIEDGQPHLVIDEDELLFDPDEVYRDVD